MPETILIPRGPLLNFWVAPVTMPHPHHAGTRTYKGAEWRFQAMKTTCYFHSEDEGVRGELHDMIATMPEGFSAKKAGREISIDVLAWNLRAYAEMLDALFAKFIQHTDLRHMLLDTGDARLVEHRPDRVWGDGMDGSGQNLQGKALMMVRAMVR